MSVLMMYSQPPEWVDSDVCMRCRTPFTFTNRKHHCRNCGNCFDQQCSTKSIPLPHLGILQAVRVDDGCYAKLTDKSGKGGGGGSGPGQERSTLYSNFPPKARSTSGMQPRDARIDDGFDEDLKKALAMSLEEVRSHSRGYVPNQTNGSSPEQTKVNGHSPTPKPAVEEEDEDLKAAIAASLADMEEQKQKHAAALKEHTSSAGATSSTPFALPKNDYELTPVEAENINLFATLVDRLQTQPPGTILREPQIQELYDSIGTLRPKLARTYGETMSKHGKFPPPSLDQKYTDDYLDTLLDLHAKLSTVVRYYDRMLEERLSKAYSQHSIGGYNLPAPRQASNPYPSIQGNIPTSVGGPAESFYTGEPQQEYGRPVLQPGYAQPSQPTPQPPYAAYDKRASISGPAQNQYPPQRADSWRAPAPSAPAQYSSQPGYPSSEAPPPQASQPQAPQESVGTTPTNDPNASFYFQQPGQPQQAPPTAAPSEPLSSPYPNLQQSMQYQPSLPQTPASVPAQPVQQAHAAPSAPPQQPQAPYWQHPAAQHVQVPAPSSAPWQQAPSVPYNNYSQEAFPSAPQHAPAPKQPVVEEALIEL